MSGLTFAQQMAAAQITVREDMNAVLREAILEAGRRLVSRSPVDTGRLASNWRYGLTTPDAFASKATSERFVHNVEEIPADLLNFRHFVTNSVEYAYYVEVGTSKMAPRGFCQLTAVEWPNIVRKAVQGVKSGGQSQKGG